MNGYFGSKAAGFNVGVPGGRRRPGRHSARDLSSLDIVILAIFSMALVVALGWAVEHDDNVSRAASIHNSPITSLE